MPRLVIGSLFSGYGGLDIAVKHVFGGRVAWHADTERAASRVLEHRFPGVPNLGDITRVDWGSVERPDILAGGFPCQDLSSAGKRRGLGPDTRSGLWAHMAHAIDQLHPNIVIWENVRGLLNAPASIRPVDRNHVGDRDADAVRALGIVLGDLADLGYDCRWLGLPASAIGTPHQRFRVFGLAWPRGTDPRSLQPQRRRADHTFPGTRPQHQQLPVDRDPAGTGIDWGRFDPAIRHWERLLGRPAEFPFMRQEGRPDRLNPRWVEWLMDLPEGWVTDVPGVSRRMALKMLGNGVVPAQGAAALRLLLKPLTVELDHAVRRL